MYTNHIMIPEGRVKLYDSARKGKYFTRKGKRIYIENCVPYTDNDGITVYQWYEFHHFEAIINEGFAWIYRLSLVRRYA